MAHRRCCCSTARPGATRAARGVCRVAPATATRVPKKPRSGRLTKKPACQSDSCRCAATLVTAQASGTDWTYTTVVADAPEQLQTVANFESAEMRWVGEDEVEELPLHPGFAASWQRLRAAPEILPLGHDDQLRRNLPRTIEIDRSLRLVHRRACPIRSRRS